jgi:hypothetical protein
MEWYPRSRNANLYHLEIIFQIAAPFLSSQWLEKESRLTIRLIQYPPQYWSPSRTLMLAAAGGLRWSLLTLYASSMEAGENRNHLATAPPLGVASRPTTEQPTLHARRLEQQAGAVRKEMKSPPGRPPEGLGESDCISGSMPVDTSRQTHQLCLRPVEAQKGEPQEHCEDQFAGVHECKISHGRCSCPQGPSAHDLRASCANRRTYPFHPTRGLIRRS